MSQKRKLLPAALGLLSLASLSVAAADALSLQGKTIGVAVVGTQHFWDREAFKGATEEVEKLGGNVIGVDGGRDNQVHANNHDILLSRKVDAVISILGDSASNQNLKHCVMPVSRYLPWIMFLNIRSTILLPITTP